MLEGQKKRKGGKRPGTWDTLESELNEMQKQFREEVAAMRKKQSPQRLEPSPQRHEPRPQHHEPSPAAVLSPTDRFIRAHECEWTKADFVVDRELGRGGFSVVVLVSLSCRQPSKSAIKIMNHAHLAKMGRGPEVVLTEYALHRKLSHVNISNVLGLLRDDVETGIIMEYCDKGDLYNYIQQRIYSFPRTITRSKAYARQICSAVEYLHTQMKVIHMDLKPENVLVTSTDTVKITDFGCAVGMDDLRAVYNKDRGGTDIYKPPELLRLKDRAFDSTADVWAIGCIVYEMLEESGSHPFFNSQDSTLEPREVRLARLNSALGDMERMRFGTYAEGSFPAMGGNAKEFLMQAIGTLRLDRPLVTQLLQLPWLTDDDEDEGEVKEGQAQ